MESWHWQIYYNQQVGYNEKQGKSCYKYFLQPVCDEGSAYPEYSNKCTDSEKGEPVSRHLHTDNNEKH